MSNILRNVLAVVVGIVVGGFVNMSIIMVGSALVSPPPGVDVNDAASIAQGIHLFEPKHFIAPFLAHAAGTLSGALLAYLIAASHKARFAWGLGAFNLCGGVAASFMIPAPAWFIALDLVAGYLPMAWLAIRIGGRYKLVAQPAGA